MKKLFYIAIVIIAFSSCSEYQKALKTEDVSVKFKMGTDLFEAGKYNKANRLFVQIVPKYRGKPQAEKLMYMYARTFYETRDYYTANYQMERFESAYPESEKVQEIAFLGAKSYYHLSPVYSKEQKETVDGLKKLQAFINSYPDSEYLAEANLLVKELDYKLEKKAFEIAKGYNKTGPHSRDYQAAITNFDNFLIDFPGTSLKEDAMYYRLDSAYKMAVNSVEWKKEQRIKDALTYYKSFKKSFSESKYGEEVDKMQEELNTLLQGYNSKS
jgi:outer membrane protein assembly factor BamD